ncbi:uncharacterized protein [Argopecten irradians]|uniref:uncharacterized protein isoform X2 n=1 Tax=Argopecten irradians TaxID=31199 RepID=UPI00371315CB
MPIANDKEIKSILQEIPSDEMGLEASLGSEAFQPNGPVFTPPVTSPDTHSNPRVRRRSRDPGFTSGSTDKNRRIPQNYLLTTTGNMVYELSSLLEQSQELLPGNASSKRAYGNTTTGHFETGVSCHGVSNLHHSEENCADKQNIIGMESEQTDRLVQASNSQTSYGMDHFAHDHGQFSNESENERDQGFSGHSTSSSCPTENEVGSSWSNFPIDWSDAEADICQHGNNKIDDLIYHFGKFFRGQIDSKLNEMGNFLHGLMSEQQTHVRYIVNTAVIASQSSTPVEKDPSLDPSLGSPVRKSSRLSSSQEVPGSPLSPIINNVDLSDASRTMLTVDKSIQDEDERRRLLLKILSKSCAVGAVLLRPEFHT